MDSDDDVFDGSSDEGTSLTAGEVKGEFDGNNNYRRIGKSETNEKLKTTLHEQTSRTPAPQSRKSSTKKTANSEPPRSRKLFYFTSV